MAFFGQPLEKCEAKINGNPASLNASIAHAASLLKQSKSPLITGLGTDIVGFRALNQLASRCDASMQHMHAGSMNRNMSVLQSVGWQMTTLTEVKNRADLLVCFGNITAHNPRFFERFVQQDGMFVRANQREIIMIGDKLDAPEGAWKLDCHVDDLPEITSVLRALVGGKPVKADAIAGVKIGDLRTLADKLKTAKYAVLAWVAKDLDFPHAELAIQNIVETVKTLNNATRAAGLALGGADGDTSANYAHSWLNGSTLQTNRYQASGAYDLQIFINSFNHHMLPQSDMPTIALGNPNMHFSKSPEVFIPIATPGLDCGGTQFRVDGAVSLPLKKVVESGLPTLAEILAKLEVALT